MAALGPRVNAVLTVPFVARWLGVGYLVRSHCFTNLKSGSITALQNVPFKSVQQCDMEHRLFGSASDAKDRMGLPQPILFQLFHWLPAFFNHIRHTPRSRLRYWIASAMCAAWMSSEPA